MFSGIEHEIDFSSLSWTRPSTGTPKVPAFIGGCEATSRSAAVIVGVLVDGKANESSVVPHVEDGHKETYRSEMHELPRQTSASVV